MDDSNKGRYHMILGRDLLATLGLDLKFSNRIIVGSRGLYKRYFLPMVDVSNYNYAPLTDKVVKPK